MLRAGRSNAPDRRRAAWCRRDRRLRLRVSQLDCRASIRSSGRPRDRGRAEFGRVGAFDAAPACAPPRSPPSACRSRCRNKGTLRSRAKRAARILPSAPRWPKPPGTRMPWTCSRCARRVVALEDLRLDPVEIDLDPIGDAAMRQRLDQRLIGVLEAGIFADDGDGDLAFGIAHALDDRVPAAHVGLRRRLDAESRQHLGCRARRRDRRAAPHRYCRRRAPRSPRFRAHCRTARACAAPPAGSRGRCGTAGCRGWMPIERSSLTECCVGLVFNSPALGMNGSSVRWM